MAEENECAGTLLDDKDVRMGSLLVPDADNQQLWIASNQHSRYYDTDGLDVATERTAVYLWDQAAFDTTGDGFCPTPVPGLPQDELISAMAITYSDAHPYLLVGYRGAVDDALFLCTLPEDALDPTLADVDCGTIPDIVCEPIPDAAGIDVSDLEVDVLDPEVVYVADGGDYRDGSGALVCSGTTIGTVWEVALDDDPAAVTVDDVGDGGWSASSFGVTGVSMDPTGTFLFAFLPGEVSQTYGLLSTIYRMPYQWLGTGPWEAVNNRDDDGNGTFDSYERSAVDPDVSLAAEARRANTDYSGSWWEADTVVTRWPEPEIFTPSQALDAAWFGASKAIVSTRHEIWRVEGLASDASGWDGDHDTTWTYWPEPDPSEPWGFSGVGGEDIAIDGQGNLWAAVRDLTAYVVPPGGVAERDCLFERLGSGGSSVAVALEDDSVWLALYDQSVPAGGIPTNISVFRTVDYGATWGYQGAAIDPGAQHRTSPERHETCRGRHGDVDGDGDMDPDWRTAEPLDGDFGGFQFTFDPADGDPVADHTFPSFGNPNSIAALNQSIAIVAFQSYNSTVHDDVPGRLAYTLDGGATWEEAEFDGGTSACDQGIFFTNNPTLSLYRHGVETWWTDTDQDGLVDGGEWQLTLVIGSRDEGGASPTSCDLARVRIDHTGADWDWYDLTRPSVLYPTACRVDGKNFLGVVASPWSEHAFIWGSYSLNKGDPEAMPSPIPDNEFGGVCAVNLADHSVERVVSAMDSDNRFELDIGGVAPHPQVSGVLLVSTRNSASSLVACANTTKATDICPPAAWPFLVVGAPGSWSSSPIFNVPGALQGGAVEWADFYDESAFYLSTAGTGTWRGSISW